MHTVFQRYRDRIRKGAPWAGMLLIIAYFLRHAHDTFQAECTLDDLMNIYGAWGRSWSDHLLDHILLIRPAPAFRPFGQIFYKAMFAIFGFPSLPYRVVLCAALLANTALVFGIVRRLTGLVHAGLITALAYSFHPEFWPLYYNNGTCFDIFAAFFYFSSLLWYIHIRQAGRPPAALEILGLCGIYALALNAKESAVSWPLLLLLYEGLWHWRKLCWRVAAPAIVITAAFVLGRVLLPAAGIGHAGGYDVHVTPAEYWKHAGHWLDAALLYPSWLRGWNAAWAVAALLPVAAVMHSRALAWFCALFFIGIAPLAFIPQRGLDAICIAAAGLCGALATLIGSRVRGWASVALFALTLIALDRFYGGRTSIAPSLPEYARIRQVRQDLTAQAPSIPPGARVRIEGNPFPGSAWPLMWIVQLTYGSRAIQVDLPGFAESEYHDGRQPDFLFRVENGSLRRY